MIDEKPVRTIAKAAFIFFTGTILAKFLTYIFRLIIARTGVEEYGLISIALAIFGVVSVISIFGMDTGQFGLISTSKKDTISVNTSGSSIENLGKDFSNNTNILLSAGDTLKMGNYYVAYKGKTKEGVNIYYEVEYFTKNTADKYEHAFTLYPLVQTNPRMGNVAEPDTRHFLTKDIYTHVTYADLETVEEKKEDAENEYDQEKEHTLSVGDTIFSSNSIITLDSLHLKVDKQKYGLPDSSIAVGASFRVTDINNKSYTAMPVYVIRNAAIEPIASIVEPLGLKFVFWKIDPETSKIEILLSEKKMNKKDFIVMEAVIFPYINILWMGCIIMIIGTLIAMRERLSKTTPH